VIAVRLTAGWPPTDGTVGDGYRTAVRRTDGRDRGGQLARSLVMRSNRSP